MEFSGEPGADQPLPEGRGEIEIVFRRALCGRVRKLDARADERLVLVLLTASGPYLPAAHET